MKLGECDAIAQFPQGFGQLLGAALNQTANLIGFAKHTWTANPPRQVAHWLKWG